MSVKWIIKQLNRSWPGVINPRRPRGSQSGWEERRESKLPLQVRRFSLFSQCGPPALHEPFCPFQKFIKCPTTCGSHPPSWNENGTTYMIHDMLPARPVRAYLLSPTADFFDGGSMRGKIMAWKTRLNSLSAVQMWPTKRQMQALLDCVDEIALDGLDGMEKCNISWLSCLLRKRLSGTGCSPC